MWFSIPIIAGFCLASAYAEQDVLQKVSSNDVSDSRPVKRVAIVGAGAAGSSAAYYIRKFSNSAGIQTNITIFERNASIGGRSTTVNAWSDPSEPVELGASIFVNVNKVLVDAVKEFNLSITSADDCRPRSLSDAPMLGVWNGDEFVLQMEKGGWWDTAKLLWKYGMAPIRTQRLMKETMRKFLRMYDEDIFPWADLSEVVGRVGLTEITGVTGKQFLEKNGIGQGFANDVVQASTRVNYAQNLALIHGLETMVCMAADGAMTVVGGNWQIFDSMSRAATSDIRLSTHVSTISHNKDSGYRLHLRRATDDISQFVEHFGTPAPEGEFEFVDSVNEDFDSVVLAGPFQESGIDLGFDLSKKVDKIDYVHLHVTLFTSPHRLSPKFFHLEEDKPVPRVILTTLPPYEKPGQSHTGVGKAGFFSISVLREVTNPKTKKSEYLYKIFSPEKIEFDWLAKLLGFEIPNTSYPDLETQKHITWYYPKLWHSYPYLPPRVTFENIVLDKAEAGSLYYTSGIESFISTMETSGLMGMNVAKLVVDELIDSDVEKEVNEEWDKEL